MFKTIHEIGIGIYSYSFSFSAWIFSSPPKVGNRRPVDFWREFIDLQFVRSLDGFQSSVKLGKQNPQKIIFCVISARLTCMCWLILNSRPLLQKGAPFHSKQVAPSLSRQRLILFHYLSSDISFSLSLLWEQQQLDYRFIPPLFR